MSLTGQSGKGKFYLEKIIGYLIPLPAVLLHSYNIFELGEDSEEKKLRNFGHMSKLGVPYLPSSLVWTKISLNKYSYSLPYLPMPKVWTFST